MQRRRFLELAALSSAFTAGCSEQIPNSFSGIDGPVDELEVDPVEHDKLIGVHYYPWYNAEYWANFPTPGTPLLGQYNTRKENIVNQHIKWAVEHGINWFNASWWGPGSKTDDHLKDGLFRSDLADHIQISILYESGGRLSEDSSGKLNFDLEENQEQLRNDFEYLEREYLNDSNYLHIGGRPVVYVYAADGFGGAIDQTFSQVLSALEVDPFLIGDVLGVGPAILQEPWLDHFDAATTYNIYEASIAEKNGFERFIEYADQSLLHQFAQTKHAGIDYIPVVIPGYNDSLFRDNPVLERSPENFQALCNIVSKRVDPDLSAVLITSFNEWPEYTAVEPAEEYGSTYLEIIKEEFAAGDFVAPNVGEFTMLELDFNKTIVPAEENPDSDDTRQISMLLDSMELLDVNDRQIRSYDIGVVSEEPAFVEGAYHIESKSGGQIRSWRWLGGITGRCLMYLKPTEARLGEAKLFGNPSQDNAIEVDVRVNGELTYRLNLGIWRGDLNEYRVSLISN